MVANLVCNHTRQWLPVNELTWLAPWVSNNQLMGRVSVCGRCSLTGVWIYMYMYILYMFLNLLQGFVTIKIILNIFYFIFTKFSFSFYYINTNEIPGELLHENLIPSRVKITCYLHMWKYHIFYGYIKNCTFDTKKLLKWNGLAFHWCLYNE